VSPHPDPAPAPSPSSIGWSRVGRSARLRTPRAVAAPVSLLSGRRHGSRAWGGTIDRRTTARPLLPRHKLAAYRVALQPLTSVRTASIRDAKLRDQAMRAAKSAALNIAEAAERVSRADRARVFAIARGEATEAAAAVEIAVLAGDAHDAAFDARLPIADRLVALLTGLAR